MLAAVGTNDSTGGASASAVADYFGTVLAKLAIVAEVTLAAGTVTADTAFGAQLIEGAVGTFFAAFLAYHVDTVGAALTAAHADIIHAEFTDTAVVTEVIFAADTVTAGAASGTQFIRRAVGTFFVALLADLGALVASVAAAAQIFHAVDAFAALGAVVAAGTVKTTFTLGAELIVRAVFAFFAAGYAYDGAVGAAVSAVADLIHAVFAQQAIRAVVALAADTIKADTALNTELQLGAVGTFFTAFGAYVGALRAAVAAGADIIHAHFAQSAVGAIVALAAATLEAYLAVTAELIVAAVFADSIAFRADDGAFRTAFAASDADLIHAEFALVAVQTVVALTAHTVITGSAVLADAAVCALFTFFFA